MFPPFIWALFEWPVCVSLLSAHVLVPCVPPGPPARDPTGNDVAYNLRTWLESARHSGKCQAGG